MDGRLPRTLEMDPNRFNQRLYRWMDNDAPWSVIPQNKGRPRMAGSGSQPQDPGYSYGYREPAPSESDTIPQGGIPPPSDSGYATQPHLDNVSLYSQPLDRNQDIQSLVGQMNDLGGFNIVQGVGSGLPPYSIGPHHNSENKGSFFCNFPGCKKPVCKTRSELNKHSARHNKPHKCDVPDCSRTEGFSTPNDLARHKQSVHGTSDGIKYVCSEGQCQSKVKFWPRADNFRAHLDRMHHIKVAADDLSPYIYKEPLSLSSENMMHLSGLGATYDPSTLPNRFPDMSPISPDKSQDDGNNLDLGTDTHYSNYDMSVLEGPGGDVYGPSGTTGLDNMPSNASQDSPAQQLPEFVRPNMLSSPMIIDSSTHPSPARTSEHRVPQEQPSTEAIDLTPDDPMQDDSSDVPSTTMMEEDRSSPTSSDCESPAHRGSGIKEPRGILASFMDDALESADLSEDHAVKLVKKLEESGILEKLGYKQTKQASPITEPKPTVKRSASNNSSEVQSFSCPDPKCSKAFSRNCELKKHMKRHDKPYGCTFGNCRKVFGSKNDWKRHENSQHFQLEVWKCDCRPSPTAEPCGKVSHRRETFRSHLQRDHSLQDSEIEKRLDSCRIGRNCEGAFWCGFCRKRVPLTKTGQLGWNERFDHIDAHFFGRTPNNKKMDISEWEAIDPDQKSLDEDGGESDSDTSALPGSRRKRGHADEPEAEELERQKRPRQYAKGRPFTMVTCCHCRSMQANPSLMKSCLEDGHHFCDNCPRETAFSNEDIEAAAS